MPIRSPICTVVGHVDHGKSSILDSIRHTNIVSKEAGRITQAIGASIIPASTIKKIAGHLLDALKIKLTIPGLLFIDTPGHAAFTNLRKRGGNLADIAILVIDINEGFKPQTQECIEILKTYKTPFVIAANKIDLIHGYRPEKGNVLDNIKKQNKEIQDKIDKKIYEIVGKLSEYNFNSERFDRIEDYTKQIAIIPTSAKTGEGIPELLMMVTGLAQKFLEKCLECNVEGPAKGTILEVKEKKGIGKALDVIIYDGSLKVNDTIVIGGIEKPIITKVKALFQPKPLAEMRDNSTKFNSVKEAHAATGVKISALDIDEVIAGMPLRSGRDIKKIEKEIQKEIEEVLIETDKEGIIIKADSLGSLEALIKLLKEKKVSIRKALIGDISKKDISEAKCDKEIKNCVILGFNVKKNPDVKDEVKIIINDVIYKLIEDLELYQKEIGKKGEKAQLDLLVKPCKIKIMPGYVFRQSNPAVCGIEVIEGTLKVGVKLMKNGKAITDVKEMQYEKESISEAKKKQQVAIAMPKVIIGRQLHENDILYSFIPENDFRKLKELKKYLSKEEIELLREIAEIMRKENAMWGV